MSKVNKIFVVFLLIAGVLCLAIGTAFAVDFMVEHPEEFACDLKRPVVAANRPFVEPVVEPPLMDVAIPEDGFPAGTYKIMFNQEYASQVVSDIYCYTGVLDPVSFQLVSTNYPPMVGLIGSSIGSIHFTIDGSSRITCIASINFDVTHVEDFSYTFVASSPYYFIFSSTESFYFTDGDDVRLDALPFDAFQPYVAPSTGVAITGAIVDILMSGLTATGEAMGEAFSVLAESIFINADGTGLSTFGILVVVFAAVSLGLSLTRWVLNFCGSWGKRNR